MNIGKYTSFFHDGSIFNIFHSGDEITISMESAEIDPKEIKEEIHLSYNNRLKGKLHIEGVKSIFENSKQFTDKFVKKHESAEIMHFKISKNRIQLEILWQKYPLNNQISDYSTIEIVAKKIWWENNPE